jgi:hypothetical protein
MLKEIIGKYRQSAQCLAIDEHKDQGGAWSKYVDFTMVFYSGHEYPYQETSLDI